ncbi:MAG TPA: pyridoxamine 5'-phosphate oxidase family protein [Desulfurella acetivorans]|uniref:Pyridoxamine 5'-phosphate oxidase family protein n=1 Tax=Desulfurella acetivorans TaxID=33002 RepID=A0A7C6EBB9_DESAE|nr:pyridoxamine 5'-phosphate oxidase family protein [Desulfurella acetivorans]
MSLKEFFENAKGTGILATADSSGNVDLALYAKPFVIDEKTIAFIMLNKLSYNNLQSNPKAAYMFLQEGYQGKRLYLKKIKEEKDQSKINEMLKHKYDDPEVLAKEKALVYFEVEKEAPILTK